MTDISTLTTLDFAGKSQSITSLRIAELTGKDHKNILRDIRNMKGEIGQLKFEPSSYLNEQGKQQPMYLLDEGESLTLASGYNIKMRKAIIDDWLLKSRSNQPIFENSTDIVRFALQQLEAKDKEIEAKKAEVSQLNTALDYLLDWVSIIKVANHNKVSEKCFNWRLLKAKSIELDIAIKKAESARFGYQNLYSLRVFRSVYPEFDYCFNSDIVMA